MGGKSILPGLVESHTHALWGACQELYEVNVNYGASYGELMAAVRSQLAADRAGYDADRWSLASRHARGDG